MNGVVEEADGRIVDFCNVYEFGSLKGDCVKAITAYAIESSGLTASRARA